MLCEIYNSLCRWDGYPAGKVNDLFEELSVIAPLIVIITERRNNNLRIKSHNIRKTAHVENFPGCQKELRHDFRICSVKIINQYNCPFISKKF